LVAVPAGETSKDMAKVIPILSFLAQQRLNRGSVIIALGGGVVGDLAGFIAGIYLRGIRFIQIPTTLLAMVDSSVGGKTGVNLPEGKNLVGAFHQPEVVFADFDTLETLPERELRAGMAEVIKYGVIADPELFERVKGGGKMDWNYLVPRCVRIKADIVAADEKETLGLRALLNFGHTLGHAVEQTAGYGNLLHGEAVAIGMVAASFLSTKRAGLSHEQDQAIVDAIRANGLPTQAKGLERDAVRRAMGLDKKVKDGKNVWVLSPKIGTAINSNDVTAEDVEAAMDLILEQ
jgi:3-dehydroquinate synthase